MKIRKQSAVRMNLWKQGLYQSPEATTKNEALQILQRIGCIQLDTLNVLTRSHNLVFLSRMRQYDEDWFWQMYDEKQIVEGYVHALSILPMEEYPYLVSSLQAFKTSMMNQESGKVDLVLDVFNQVRKRAPVTSRDLGDIHLDAASLFDDQPARQNDWSTTPIRWALDQLWRAGMLIATRNINFQKVYHMPDDYLPPTLMLEGIDRTTMYERYTCLALDAMGAATEAEIAYYFRLNRSCVRQVIQKLIAAEEVLEVELEGEHEVHYIRPMDLELMHSHVLENEPQHCAFLSPFDNLIWNRQRVLKLFHVDYRLESYLPQNQRKYGYFALPILIRGRIVGTIDLNFDRNERCLIVKKWVLFNFFERAMLIGEIVEMLRQLMAFLGAKHIKSDHSNDDGALLDFNTLL